MKTQVETNETNEKMIGAHLTVFLTHSNPGGTALLLVTSLMSIMWSGRLSPPRRFTQSRDCRDDERPELSGVCGERTTNPGGRGSFFSGNSIPMSTMADRQVLRRETEQ